MGYFGCSLRGSGTAQLQQQISRFSANSGYAVVFFQMIELGSLVKFNDMGVDAQHAIVFEKFEDRNQTLVIHTRTRKRQTVLKQCHLLLCFVDFILSHRRCHSKRSLAEMEVILL